MTELERCDLCGAEVRHTHPGMNRETDSPCKLCCSCRDNLPNPLESFLKEATPPHGSFVSVPCVIDEVMDLDDEGILALYANAIKSVKTKLNLENVLKSFAIVKACATELERRGRDDLNEDLAKQLNEKDQKEEA
jgi:hypothetical protein